MGELTMYTVTHIPMTRVPAGRTPIFVGGGQNPAGWLTDGTGDHIASRNPFYCELTALYWIWKNDHTSRYVSIEHYRRFFLRPLPFALADQAYLLKLLRQGTIVVSRPVKWQVNVRQEYGASHCSDDLQAAEDAIRRLYPDYLPDFQAVMDQHTISICNMTAMPKSMLDAYCTWLFSILFAAEPAIRLDGRCSYQKRAYGFLGERLLNVWVRHNAPKVRRLPICFRGPSPLSTLYHTASLYLHSVF